MEAPPRLLTRKRRSLERFSASRLEAVKRAGGSSALLQYEDVYRDRLAQIPIKAQSSGQVIGAESITRFPTSKPVRTRGLSEQARVEPHINIQIRFNFDSARLRAGANELLDEIGQALKHEALNDRHIIIEGHTDSTGTATYNRKLSIKRSATVRLELMGRGIEGHRLSALGFAKTMLLADNATEDGQTRDFRQYGEMLSALTFVGAVVPKCRKAFPDDTT